MKESEARDDGIMVSNEYITPARPGSVSEKIDLELLLRSYARVLFKLRALPIFAAD